MKLTITRKLSLGFGIVILIIIVNVILTSLISFRNNKLNAQITTEIEPSANLLNELANQISSSKMLIKNWVFIDKVANTSEKQKLIDLHSKEYPELDKKITEISVKWSQEQLSQYKRIARYIADTLYLQHKQVMEKLSNLESYNDFMVMSEITPMMEGNNSLISQSDYIITEINKLRGIFEEKANELQQEMDKAVKNFQLFTLIAGIIVIAITLIVSIVIARSILNPLKKGVNFAQTIENGDITARIDIDEGDEFGDLAKALRSMQNKLAEILGIFITCAENISLASGQMNDSSRNLSSNAASQAAATEEISSSIEEIASNIQQNTNNSMETEKISITAASEIKKVNEAAHNSAASMKRIAEKISVINDIAFQTNILALNAAVEAARAGEHGKGFAVVAAEVRKLAERSKIAAEEISQLTQKSLLDSEESTRQLEAVVPEIEHTAKLIKEITAANLEQNSSIDQINNSIQLLNTSTQQSAQSSDKMLTNSDDLSRLAAELKETAEYFRV